VNSINISMIVIGMVGGLALFLFGMKVLSEGLQRAFGNKLKILLERVTGNKLGGVAIGAVVTAIIQSSSITTVTLVGLINAGIITLGQSIPVIMGANIGTTITAQLIAFKVGKFALPIIAIGFVLYSVSKKYSYKYAGQVILGFGILFLGMNIMSAEARLLTKNAAVVNILANMGKVPTLGVLAGTIFTAIIQSVAIMLGANIGTCITVVLASIGSTISSKRAALAHVLIKVIGVSIFLIILTPFINMVKLTSSDLSRQIANAHMFFNVIVTIILLPLADVIEKIVIKLIPGEEPKVEEGSRYLDENILKTPAAALAVAEREAIRMARITLSMIESSRMALFEMDTKEIEVVKQKEKVVDILDDEIEIFLSRINQDGLSAHQQASLAVLNHAISDIERIADHANNICELAEKRIKQKVRFSNEDFEELKEVFDKADQSVMLCADVLLTGSFASVNKIKAIEQEVDDMVIEMENDHYERLDQGTSTALSGPIYLEILSNLERITDHTQNIASAKSIGF